MSLSTTGWTHRDAVNPHTLDLTLLQTKELIDILPDLIENVYAVGSGNASLEYEHNLGGDVYATVNAPFKCASVRHHVMGSKKRYPSAKGVTLRMGELRRDISSK